MRCTFRKLLIPIFFIIPFTGIMAQNSAIEIRKNNNSILKFDLQSISKITFSDATLNLGFNNGSNQLIPVSEINKILFGIISGIRNQKIDTKSIVIFPNPASEFIGFKNVNEHSVIEIFTTNGICVLKNLITNTTETINISQLNKGLYLIKINNQTIKLSKQ